MWGWIIQFQWECMRRKECWRGSGFILGTFRSLRSKWRRFLLKYRLLCSSLFINSWFLKLLFFQKISILQVIDRRGFKLDRPFVWFKNKGVYWYFWIDMRVKYLGTSMSCSSTRFSNLCVISWVPMIFLPLTFSVCAHWACVNRIVLVKLLRVSNYLLYYILNILTTNRILQEVINWVIKLSCTFI